MRSQYRIAALTVLMAIGAQPSYAACVGDCDGNNKVAVNELLIGVNIALTIVRVSTAMRAAAWM
jgi:hypothetical protein